MALAMTVRKARTVPGQHQPPWTSPPNGAPRATGTGGFGGPIGGPVGAPTKWNGNMECGLGWWRPRLGLAIGATLRGGTRFALGTWSRGAGMARGGNREPDRAP